MSPLVSWGFCGSGVLARCIMVERGACWEAEHHKMAEEEEEGDDEEGKEPEMDGTCDACEPDEAQPATHVCPACRFAFCPPHADTHTLSTRHQTIPYHPEPTTAAAAAAGARPKGRPTAESLQGAPNGDVCHPGGCPSGGAVGLDEGQERMEAAEQGAPSGAVGGAEGCRNGGVEEMDDGGAVGGEAAPSEAEVQGQEGGAGKKEGVSVERLRCREHDQEGSLYCKLDERIICVLCAVQGDHRQHEIITLREAYHWQKSREGIDLVGRTQEMAEKIKNRWTSPDMNKDELEVYVNQQFDQLHHLVRLEEKRTLHLVDLKEAFLTAQASEMIAEISVNTERLQEEVDCITQQLGELEQAEAQGGPQAAGAAAGPDGADAPGAGAEPAAAGAAVAGHQAEAAVAAPVPAPLPAAMAQGLRLALGADARPRMPEHRPEPRGRRGYRDGDSDSSRGGYAP
ncbi:tripartite motif-containing protein 44 isoform X2 [Clupea harengus]|uniref:Tripartite motif-containing protein 44 isoform X2 n=1 Tax=Clupea harengus TaxID=7950 RepID=A0A6P8F7F3_CLUHA|nr:tripartite motif-containing protein 44 isoform X2 [Clupea harengus]